jgi:hypothetical protein
VRDILFLASASDFTESNLPDTLKFQVRFADGTACWRDPQVRNARGWSLL